MQIKEIPLTKITPYHRNPRHAEAAVPKVMGSIRKFGWRQPIVVDKDHVIIVGHARFLAAKRLGLKKVPVHVADDMPPDQVKAYRLADNRSHEEATWDGDALKIELSELDEAGVDLTLTGFDEKELTKALKGKNGAAEEQDASPQLGALGYSIVLRCFDEEEQKRLLERFEKEGYACQALIS